MTEDDERRDDDYAPPHALGLDPERADKFAVSKDDPFYVVDENGKKMQIVLDERGEPKRVPVE